VTEEVTEMVKVDCDGDGVCRNGGGGSVDVSGGGVDVDVGGDVDGGGVDVVVDMVPNENWMNRY
jgi:hypothetical protein